MKYLVHNILKNKIKNILGVHCFFGTDNHFDK